MAWDDVVLNVCGGLMILIIILVFLAMVIGIPMAIWSSLEKECYKPKQLKLVSVNGMHDENTGLFSGGTVNQKTLLFDNGLLITESGSYFRNIELRIGKYYPVKKCVSNGGLFNYKIS